MVDNDMSIAKLQTIYTYFTQLIPCMKGASSLCKVGRY